MKYTEQQYLESNFYRRHEEEKDYQAKITTARRPHECVNCGGEIKPKQKYFRESCILSGEGRRTSKTCLPCIDKWLDQITTNSQCPGPALCLQVPCDYCDKL